MDQEERRINMAYKVRINNETYNLKDSFTIKDELNETLDSGTIQFALYGGELKAVPKIPLVAVTSYLSIRSLIGSAAI